MGVVLGSPLEAEFEIRLPDVSQQIGVEASVGGSSPAPKGQPNWSVVDELVDVAPSSDRWRPESSQAAGAVAGARVDEFVAFDDVAFAEQPSTAQAASLAATTRSEVAVGPAHAV